MPQVDTVDDDEWNRAADLDELRETYAFYIMNPRQQNGVNYSLWHCGDDGEFPVLSSNTGGFSTFNSRSETVGDALKLSEEFFTLVAVGTHEALCFTPDLYFRRGNFEDTFNSIYDGKPREHEVWAAQTLISFLTHGDIIPELEPLAEWVGRHTEFEIPALTETDTDE